MTRLRAARSALADASATLRTSELAFVASQQSQAGSLAVVALHELALLVLLPAARWIRSRVGARPLADLPPAGLASPQEGKAFLF